LVAANRANDKIDAPAALLLQAARRAESLRRQFIRSCVFEHGAARRRRSPPLAEICALEATRIDKRASGVRCAPELVRFAAPRRRLAQSQWVEALETSAKSPAAVRMEISRRLSAYRRWTDSVRWAKALMRLTNPSL